MADDFNIDNYQEAKAYAIKGLLAAGMGYQQISDELGVSERTISAIKKSEKLDPDRVKRIKDALPAKIYEKIDLSLESITPDKLEKATAHQAIMVAAIGIDKARLIEGQATSRMEFVNTTDRELAGQIAELSAKLEQMQTGEILDAELSTNQSELESTEVVGLSPTNSEEGLSPNPSTNQPVSDSTSE